MDSNTTVAKKQLKDYMHLYLGCKIFWGNPNSDSYGTIVLHGENLQKAINLKWKPILRPISDLGKKDQDFFGCDDEHFEYMKTMTHQIIYLHADEFAYLLSQHVDLFGLIEAGLAIGATTIK